MGEITHRVAGKAIFLLSDLLFPPFPFSIPFLSLLF